MIFRKKNSPSPPTLQNIIPLANAFAHNDYASNYPLYDSLRLGFNFIEADIHLINDDLFVSHLRPIFPNKNKTLRSLYLNPLFDFFKKNNKKIYPKAVQPLRLLIDIKTDAEKTYECLKRQLEPFREMFCQCTEGTFKKGAVQIIISGNRPKEMIQSESYQLVSIDGRLDDVGKGYSSDLMPLISANYSSILGWYFFWQLPSEEKLKNLQQLSQKVKQEGKQLRLWAIPENEKLWQILQQNGLEIISTDRISNLSNYFKLREK